MEDEYLFSGSTNKLTSLSKLPQDIVQKPLKKRDVLRGFNCIDFVRQCHVD